MEIVAMFCHNSRNMVLYDYTGVAGLFHGAECKILLVLCIATFLGAALRSFLQIEYDSWRKLEFHEESRVDHSGGLHQIHKFLLNLAQLKILNDNPSHGLLLLIALC
jgi:hypothetical protein